MAKIMKYENDAKQKILAGIEKLEKAVSTTLGPAGHNVIIDEYGSIHSTKDGVSVAKAISLKDPFENIGANAVKEVAERSGDKVGDGTTTSTILAAEIYRNGLKYVSLGSNANQVKNGIKKAAAKVIEDVKAISKSINGKEDLKRVASVSANGDEEIGEMIADVMAKIGNDGTIKVENGSGYEMSSKIVDGMVIDNGYVSPWMVTNQETMEAELDNPFILLVDKKISNLQSELLPCIQSVANPQAPWAGRPLLIIAEDYSDEVTATIVMNKMRGALNAVCIKSPSFGDNRKAILEDIAVLCGGQVVSDQTGVKIQSATVEEGNILGQAKRVLVTKDNCIIFDGVGEKSAVETRANAIRAQIEKTTETYDKEKLQERLAKLTSGVGVINVGAATEAERKELRDRVDDAFCASKAALRAGVVAGGGAALLNAKQKLQKWIDSQTFSDDEKIGAKILCNSLEAPIKKILSNAGIASDMIIAKILENVDSCNIGYNVLKQDYVDMIEDGILDPTEVVVNEVMNASSIASLLLTTEVLVAEEPTDSKPEGSHPSCSSCMG